MAKFRVRLKLQGFELDVEASRAEDLASIRESVTQQFVGLLTPGADIAAGEPALPKHAGNGSTALATSSESSSKRSGGRKRTSRGATQTTSQPEEPMVEWRHDAGKYGTPQQRWGGVDKAIWVLYVARAEVNAQEMSISQIVGTIDRQFRQAVAPRPSNLSRDLGRATQARNGTPPLVSENATKKPSMWFLTDAGIKHAESLVAQALGQVASE
jgi:hypothetical protein